MKEDLKFCLFFFLLSNYFHIIHQKTPTKNNFFFMQRRSKHLLLLLLLLPLKLFSTLFTKKHQPRTTTTTSLCKEDQNIYFFFFFLLLLLSHSLHILHKIILTKAATATSVSERSKTFLFLPSLPDYLHILTKKHQQRQRQLLYAKEIKTNLFLRLSSHPSRKTPTDTA
jgi:hypothetical protein